MYLYWKQNNAEIHAPKPFPEKKVRFDWTKKTSTCINLAYISSVVITTFISPFPCFLNRIVSHDNTISLEAKRHKISYKDLQEAKKKLLHPFRHKYVVVLLSYSCNISEHMFYDVEVLYLLHRLLNVVLLCNIRWISRPEQFWYSYNSRHTAWRQFKDKWCQLL